MSHLPYTNCRSGTYHYNRHVPKHSVSTYGYFIRQSLSHYPDEAAEYAFRCIGGIFEKVIYYQCYKYSGRLGGTKPYVKVDILSCNKLYIKQ